MSSPSPLMQNPLITVFKNTITEGLLAAKTRQIDHWVQRYRYVLTADPANPSRPKVARPYSFDRYPWTREMHLASAPFCVGMKAAQMGFTEVMIDKALFANVQMRQDVLYVLPNEQPDAKDFSVMRFDTALELSPYLANMYNDTKNVGLKRVGQNALYVRGSRSRSALKSLPVSLIVLDEFEEFDEGALPLVLERLSGQDQKQIWMISTPMVQEEGVHRQYLQSNQKHFVFPCPSCSRHIRLVYPDSLVITGELYSQDILNSYLICTECKATLPHAQKPLFLNKGFWAADFPDRQFEGFHINQLYSPTITPGEIASSALRAESNFADEQEFYNSKLGEPHTVDNARVTDQHVTACMRDYSMNDMRFLSTGITTLGIDVGTDCHWEVVNWRFREQRQSFEINQEAIGHLVACGTFRDFMDATRLMHIYRPHKAVIDHLPDTRKATEFARQWPGIVYLCHYGNGGRAKEVVQHPDSVMVSVDRTVWIDQALSRFMNGTISLPKDIPNDYRKHVQALVRIYEKDKKGEIGVFYKKVGPDHFAHARTYSEIALRLCESIGGNTNITKSV